MSREALKLALDDLMAEYCMERTSFARRVDEIFKQALAAPVQPVAWKWHQAPVKTSWGPDMVVADLAIDKDNTVSVYCERDQTAKVEAMFNPPAQEFICSTGLCHYKPAAPVQPVASLKEADVLMIAEAHNIDPRTKGLYGFYIDCISSQPAAQPAPVQEPVAERFEAMHASGDVWITTIAAAQIARSATPPAAQRPWVGLTGEQRSAIIRHHSFADDIIRVTAAKLKELNT